MAVLCAAAAAWAAPAAAQQPLWEAGAGIALMRLPDYRGSRVEHDWALPVPYLVYRGRFLRADRGGARALLYDGDKVDLDLSLWAGPPTRDGAEGARAGMPALPPTFEIGPKAELTLLRGGQWKVDLRVPLRAVMAFDSGLRHLGWSAEAVVNADLRAQGWNLGLQAGPLWGDRRWHQHVYGVPIAYATASRPAYAPGGGYAGWQATASTSRRFGRLWVGAFVRHDRIRGTAFDASPLLERRQHAAVGVALSWVMAVSDERVAEDD